MAVPSATLYVDVRPRLVLDGLPAYLADMFAATEAPVSVPQEPQRGDRVRIVEVNGGSPALVGAVGTYLYERKNYFGTDVLVVDLADGSPKVYATAIEKAEEVDEEVRVMQDDALADARSVTSDVLVLVDKDGDEIRFFVEDDAVAYVRSAGAYIETVEDLTRVIDYLTAIRTLKEAEA